MQIIGKPVRYREAGQTFTALITGVADEERGIVNLAVFSDGGCINRNNVLPGPQSGRWEPIAKQALVDRSDEFETLENGMVQLAEAVNRLNAQVAELQSKLAPPTGSITAASMAAADAVAPSSPSSPASTDAPAPFEAPAQPSSPSE